MLFSRFWTLEDWIEEETMKMSFRLVFVAAMVLGLAAAAFAGPIAGFIPQKSAANDFIGKLPGTTSDISVGGYYDADIFYYGDPVTITVDYYDGEAGWTNSFAWDGVTLFTHIGSGSVPDGSIVGTQDISGVTSGLLPFLFSTNGGQKVVNGSNIPNDDNTIPNFFVSFDLTKTFGGPTSGQTVWLFFDDGGAQNDDNHDDMLVRLSIDKGSFYVPDVSSTLLLFSIGMCAIIGWRRK